MKFKTVFLGLAALSIMIASCGEKESPENGGDGGSTVPSGNVEIKPARDLNSILKNPLNGWVMYVSSTADPSYFDTEFTVNTGETVKVRDYATCFYVRAGWKKFNPEPDKYFWQIPDDPLNKLYQRAQELGLPMAFRVVVDGRDQGENTPEWVYDKGAAYWPSSGLPRFSDRKVPDVMDPVWRACYEKFIEDFAAEFNDPSKIAFIDAYGLGKWGEGHNVCYEGLEVTGTEEENGVTYPTYGDGIVSDNTPEYKKNTMEWITGLYSRCFTNVPLVINYHRQIGHPRSSGAQAQPDSEELLEIAIRNGYSLRSDAIGMTNNDWGYNDWERSFVAKWNCTGSDLVNRRPVLMEGGYIVSSHSYWNDPKGYRQGHPEDVRQGEFDESREARVNMMDFRVGDETKSWFENAFSLVEQFVQEGGYRLYPDLVTVPEKVSIGSDITVTSRWRNAGWGYCPTNIPQWNQKYKVAFALLDMETDSPVYQFVDMDTDLSTWLSSAPTSYTFDISMKSVAIGGYTWAVGIVDTTLDEGEGIHPIGIQVAVNKDSLTEDGWVKLTNVTVN